MPSGPATNTGLSESFKSPFQRVQMEERMDDSLACIATLTGRTLEDVHTMVVQFRLPAFGPTSSRKPISQPCSLTWAA